MLLCRLRFPICMDILILPESNEKNIKIAFITAVMGGYEKSTKYIARQTVPFDKYFFTDNVTLENSNNWTIVDINGMNIKSPLDDGSYVNSLINNNHTFNEAKYFKEQFYRIRQLQDYDIIIWLDGTIEIVDHYICHKVIQLFEQNPPMMVASINHDLRQGKLKNEVIGSLFFRYTDTFWNDQYQPVQNVTRQYEYYLQNGFEDVGVWITCFVAWNMRHPKTREFLDEWYIQNLNFSTQDQVGFPYVIWKFNSTKSIYTFPQDSFYIKHAHGI